MKTTQQKATHLHKRHKVSFRFIIVIPGDLMKIIVNCTVLIFVFTHLNIYFDNANDRKNARKSVHKQKSDNLRSVDVLYCKGKF